MQGWLSFSNTRQHLSVSLLVPLPPVLTYIHVTAESIANDFLLMNDKHVRTLMSTATVIVILSSLSASNPQPHHFGPACLACVSEDLRAAVWCLHAETSSHALARLMHEFDSQKPTVALLA